MPFMLKSCFLAGNIAMVALVLTGCSTPQPPDLMAEAAASGEKPVAMKGESGFFDGKLTAMVTISRGFGPGNLAGHKGKKKYDESNKPIMAEVDPFTGSEDNSEEAQEKMYEEMMRRERWRRAAGSPMPPVTLRIKLENHGHEPVEVEILEVNSDLGNFAVRPAKLSLAAGKSDQPNPMISQLGVTSDEIPVKVGLRLGGKKETHTIMVKSVFTGKKSP